MSLRPDALPDWATDTNYNDPGEDWDGQPTKVEPSSGMVDSGFVPGDELGIDHLNHLLSEHAKWLKHLEGRDVSVLKEIWVGKAFAATTADPVVNFTRWKFTTTAGGAGLVSTSTDYNGPFVAISAGGPGDPAVLETTIPICRRADDSIIRFDFDAAFGGLAADADPRFGLRAGSTDFARFYFDQFINANWQIESRNGTTTTTTVTSVVGVASNWPNARFSIVLKGANVGDSIEYYINDVLVHTEAGADGPRSTANLSVYFQASGDASGTSELKIGAGQVDWNRR